MELCREIKDEFFKDKGRNGSHRLNIEPMKVCFSILFISPVEMYSLTLRM